MTALSRANDVTLRTNSSGNHSSSNSDAKDKSIATSSSGIKRRRDHPADEVKKSSSSSSLHHFLVAPPSAAEFTKAECQEMNATLPSLLLPWVLLVVMAISTTVFQSAFSSDDDEFDDMVGSTTLDVVDLSLFSTSTTLDLSTRMMTGDVTTTTTSSAEAAEVAARRLGHHHHPSLFTLTTSDCIGFFLATLGLMVAAGGGIGGGGILVPIFSLVHGFSAKHAIPLSNVTVFGGAVANTVLNARKRHPLADRPLVDWDLILVMEPLTIAGALIGAVAHGYCFVFFFCGGLWRFVDLEEKRVDNSL